MFLNIHIYIKMETFSVDKSFYDIGTSDLKELWDSDLDPVSNVMNCL